MSILEGAFHVDGRVHHDEQGVSQDVGEEDSWCKNINEISDQGWEDIFLHE